MATSTCATPIKGTPKLLMRSRSPSELADLQGAVQQGFERRVTQPLMDLAEKPISKLPKGKLQSGARWMAQRIADDPVGMALVEAVPVPGGSFLYQGAKKGLERAIDRFAPLSV